MFYFVCLKCIKWILPDHWKYFWHTDYNNCITVYLLDEFIYRLLFFFNFLTTYLYIILCLYFLLFSFKWFSKWKASESKYMSIFYKFLPLLKDNFLFSDCNITHCTNKETNKKPWHLKKKTGLPQFVFAYTHDSLFPSFFSRIISSFLPFFLRRTVESNYSKMFCNLLLFT